MCEAYYEMWQQEYDDLVLLKEIPKHRESQMTYNPPTGMATHAVDAEINSVLQPGNTMMPNAIAFATSQSRNAARREHIKADRIERVNLFVTDLRRAIIGNSLSKPAKDFFVSALCQKEVWHDIAVVGATPKLGQRSTYYGYSSSLKLTQEVLENWCLQARNMIPEKPEIDIQTELNELKQQMISVNSLIKVAEKINADAEPIVNGLVALSEELELHGVRS